MKIRIVLFCLFVCLSIFAPTLRADSPPWTGDGVYTFDATDPYFIEGGISDTATVYINGGSFGALHGFDYSKIYMFGGNAITGIRLNSYSNLFLSGGSIYKLYALDNSFAELKAIDWEFKASPFIGYDGLLTGKWLETEQEFEILISLNSWQNIHMVPEPSIFLLAIMGLPFIRKRFCW